MMMMVVLMVMVVMVVMLLMMLLLIDGNVGGKLASGQTFRRLGCVLLFG